MLPIDASAPTLDEIADALQKLRLNAGNISYADIATNITDCRIAAGLPAHAAMVARSTVYDCFRAGRKRMNVKLVAEIVAVLTDDGELADYWRSQCVTAQAPNQAAELATPLHVVPEHMVPERMVPAVDASPEITMVPPLPTRRTRPFIMAMLVIGIVVNIVPYLVGQTIFGGYSPLFFDMIGTAIVAITLGPLMGVLTAILSAIVGVAFAETTGLLSTSFHFAPVAVIGALMWAFGVHKFHYGKTLPRFVLLNILVGIVCSLVAFTIILLAFEGNTMNPMVQTMADTAVSFGIPPAFAAMISNLLISLIDKSIAGFVALIVGGMTLRQVSRPNLGAFTAPLRMSLNAASS